MKQGLVRALSWLIPAAALAYLGVFFAGSGLHDLLGHLEARTLAIAVAAAAIYAAALYLLSLAWGLTLRRLATARVDLETALRIYAFSTFAKYLPGNVFHYAGRQLAAGRRGYGQKAVAQATLIEIAGHVGATLVLLSALLPFVQGQIPWIDELLGIRRALANAVMILTTICLGAIAFILLWRYRRVPALDRRTIAVVAGLQLSFFIVSTLLGMWLAAVVLAPAPGALAGIAFAWLLSWLIGFVVPGAPGGLGVREACLLIALAGHGDSTAILAFIALSRGALLLGEVLFALSGFLLGERRRPIAGHRAV